MRISFIFGTRPEAIKLCPVVLEFKEDDRYEVEVCLTGQHREMLHSVLKIFDVKPDINLDLMTENQTLSGLTTRAINAVDDYLKSSRPEMVIVQGDTTTAFSASLAAFYNKITVGHVEAGLRTYNKYSPYPEEVNRTLISKIADLHFAPTKLSQKNLLAENINKNKVFVTGNSVIDALHFVIRKLENQNSDKLEEDLKLKNINTRDLVLITGHRRENFGDRFKNICVAIKRLAFKFQDKLFVYPVHLNPNVQEPVYDILSDVKNVKLLPPLDYLPFVYLMNKSSLVLTDSGGIQEEAPSLGKPVLVMRHNTERMEAVEAGTVKLVGTDTDDIVMEVSKLLTDKDYYQEMAAKKNPYGDGNASSKISNIVADFLKQ